MPIGISAVGYSNWIQLELLIIVAILLPIGLSWWEGFLFKFKGSVRPLCFKRDKFRMIIPENNHKTNEQLMAEVEILQQKLKKSMEDTIRAISRTCEIRDPYTAGHECRVTQLALCIAEEMNLPKDRKESLRIASSIHDIGKISVPSEILSKAGNLSETELTMIKIHVQVGFDIVRNIDFSLPVAEIILQHHERLDGSGYPLGVTAKDILLESKILAVADVVEAMVSHRPYRPALGIEKALQEITFNKGVLYDPDVVEVCSRVFNQKAFKFKD